MRFIHIIVVCTGWIPCLQGNRADPRRASQVIRRDEMGQMIKGTIGQGRELQTGYNESVVNVAVLFDTRDVFSWTKQIVDLTFEMINDHSDGWHDDIFPDGTLIEHVLADAGCDETNATLAYWDTRGKWKGMVHGVVGCRCSGASMAVGRVTALENVPQVSPASSTPVLSDKRQFPSFSRLVAPSTADGEVGAMVSVLRSFGWNRVTILSTDSQYAKDFTTRFEDLWREKQEHGDEAGEIAYTYTITIDLEGQVEKDSVEKALDGVPIEDPVKNSRVILLVADIAHSYPILQIARAREFQPDTIWVGSGSWAGRILPNGTNFDFPPDPGYLGVTPYRNRDNEYQVFRERLNQKLLEDEDDRMTELPDYTAAFLIDSIVALAKALSSVPKDERRNGTLVTSELRKLEFSGVGGEVSFTQDGDRKNPLYTILNMQMINGVAEWVDVGLANATWAEPKRAQICFAKLGCNLEPFPSDQYPIRPEPLEPWVIGLITACAVLFVLFLSLSLLSLINHRQKKDLKARMKAINEELMGLDDKVEDAQRRKANLMKLRAALVEKPNTWSASDDGLVEVTPFDPQYWTVFNRMRRDMSDVHISKLWRIQNMSLWTYYTFHRDRLEMNGIDPNETTVWHGTSNVDPCAIYNDRHDGFMMQYSRSGLWGRGIYFADKSSYSDHYAHNPSGDSSALLPTDRGAPANDEREMFLTKLLIGKEVFLDRDESPEKAASCKRLVVPPIDPATGWKYNTVSGQTNQSKVWVVYENGRAYPDYLVRYYRGSRDPSRTPFVNQRVANRHAAGHTSLPVAPESAPDIETGETSNFSWEYQDNEGGWSPYADVHQVELESAFQAMTVAQTASSSSTVRLKIGRWEYEVDIGSMQQKNINHSSGRVRAIRRKTDEE